MARCFPELLFMTGIECAREASLWPHIDGGGELSDLRSHIVVVVVENTRTRFRVSIWYLCVLENPSVVVVGWLVGWMENSRNINSPIRLPCTSSCSTNTAATLTCASFGWSTSWSPSSQATGTDRARNVHHFWSCTSSSFNWLPIVQPSLFENELASWFHSST